jgi:hypothetical protein
MPVQVSYPGVYIEEIPSGVHTIVGVPTSVTAFVGRSAKGPVNEPTTCFGYADFVRFFGPAGSDQNRLPFNMSHAVQDFFMNGGGEAIIVRLTEETPTPAPTSGQGKPAGGQPAGGQPANPAGGQGQSAKPRPASAAEEKANPTGCNLVAASEGIWGDDLTAWVDYDGLPAEAAANKAFNLTIKLDSKTQPATERFVNCSVDPDAGKKRLDVVLEQGSMLVRVGSAGLPDDRPKATPPDAKAKKPAAATFEGGNDGPPLSAKTLQGDPSQRTGIYALKDVDIFNILCIPPDIGQDIESTAFQAAAEFCVERRAMLIVDSPTGWVNPVRQNQFDSIDPSSFNFTEAQERNSAVYFPRIRKTDTADARIKVFPACGAIAGQMASTDLSRGVWKAPAGIETALGGIEGLELKLSDGENGMLNPIGINCLRTFPILGSLIWGARTLRGADIEEDDYKYVPVRRLTLYVEESLYRGTKWAVFEPNDETLWSSLRTSIGSFMADLSRQGAFYDFQVICDKTTTTARDIELGIVNVVVAFAPVKPAEFVVLKIQQEAGRAPA